MNLNSPDLYPDHYMCLPILKESRALKYSTSRVCPAKTKYKLGREHDMLEG